MLQIPTLGAVRRRAGAGGAPLHVATFTATSAVCATGLTVVDTATYGRPSAR